MFNVNLEVETCQVTVNFEDLVSPYEEYRQYDEYDAWLEHCFDIMEYFKKTFPKNSVDNPQDYYYTVECTEYDANIVEDWFYARFNRLEDEINDIISELEEEYDEEEEE